jgi:hypothetical protein
MPCTMIVAHRQVLALLVDALPGDLPVKWPDVATAPGFPPASGSWARVSITDTEPARPPPLVGDPANRRYSMDGLLTVAFYAIGGDGRRAAQALGQRVLDAFRGQKTAGGVWFRRERVNDVGADGPWWHVNTIVEYQYDTVG